MRRSKRDFHTLSSPTRSLTRSAEFAGLRLGYPGDTTLVGLRPAQCRRVRSDRADSPRHPASRLTSCIEAKWSHLGHPPQTLALSRSSIQCSFWVVTDGKIVLGNREEDCHCACKLASRICTRETKQAQTRPTTRGRTAPRPHHTLVTSRSRLLQKRAMSSTISPSIAQPMNLALGQTKGAPLQETTGSPSWDW